MLQYVKKARINGVYKMFIDCTVYQRIKRQE